MELKSKSSVESLHIQFKHLSQTLKLSLDFFFFKPTHCCSWSGSCRWSLPMLHCAELGLLENVWEKRGDEKTKGEEEEGKGYERTKMGGKSE